MIGNSRPARSARGFTLVELLVAIVVLSMISVLIYNAFASMKRSREGIERVDDRYREGRLAMTRMIRELQSAYISLHAPLNPSLLIQRTAFIATTGTPADRLDFNSFSNRRLDKNSHVSDQCELSYFGSPNPDLSGVTDLARRISTSLDLDPKKGGRVDVLATDIDLFDLQYLDPLSGNWVDTWDTTQTLTGQPARLPVQVRILLVLNGGSRQGYDRGQGTIRLVSKVSLPIDNALNFAVMQ
ncbi:MAG TPA: prepilin-type N-terminal cleavage/methylation domain-containing protein [Polyangiaceae bacterium]|nr:prepilin-type N-terminal cleavage/methylation domain-containing protein [Polyangiaceae bacterium]